jgi:hypothetical protein
LKLIACLGLKSTKIQNIAAARNSMDLVVKARRKFDDESAHATGKGHDSAGGN